MEKDLSRPPHPAPGCPFQGQSRTDPRQAAPGGRAAEPGALGLIQAGTDPSVLPLFFVSSCAISTFPVPKPCRESQPACCPQTHISQPLLPAALLQHSARLKGQSWTVLRERLDGRGKGYRVSMGLEDFFQAQASHPNGTWGREGQPQSPLRSSICSQAQGRWPELFPPSSPSRPGGVGAQSHPITPSGCQLPCRLLGSCLRVRCRGSCAQAAGFQHASFSCKPAPAPHKSQAAFAGTPTRPPRQGADARRCHFPQQCQAGGRTWSFATPRGDASELPRATRHSPSREGPGKDAPTFTLSLKHCVLITWVLLY